MNDTERMTGELLEAYMKLVSATVAEVADGGPAEALTAVVGDMTEHQVRAMLIVRVAAEAQTQIQLSERLDDAQAFGALGDNPTLN